MKRDAACRGRHAPRLAAPSGCCAGGYLPSRPHSLIRLFRYSVIAFSSWKFWCGTALAAGTAAVALVIYNEIHAEPGEAGSYPYQKLQAAATDPSVRLMLFNRIKTSLACPVDYDNFTGATTPTKTSRNWWEFLNDDAVKLTGYNLQKGTHFVCHAKGNDGPVLWEIINCRGGNLNPTSTGGKPQTYQNLLPWSSEAYSFKNRLTTANQTTAGTLVMQNTPDAEVISSCLPEGIGTIYFDAVNGFTGYLKGRLQVQVAYGVYVTNKWGKVEDATRANFVLEKDADGNLVPPDDAHCDVYETLHEGEDPLIIPYDRVAWVPVNLTGKWNCNDHLGDIPTGEELKLKMPEYGTTAGTFENFYRVWAPIADPKVNPAVEPYSRGPMRFRIKRLDNPPIDSGYSGMSLDGENLGTKSNNALLILDNIIASYPPMKAWAIPPHAEYVNGGGPRNVIGWSGIVEPTKYPAAGETNLSVRAGLAFATNAPPGVTGEWLGGLTADFTYAWRYRDQAFGATNNLPLAADGGTNLVSSENLDLPPVIGDVEFWYTTTVDAPYYDYLDYSGSAKIVGTPGYTERIKSVESRFNPEARGQYGVPDLLPSCGTDFFFRLRPGRSDQLEYRLEVRKPGAAETSRTPAFWLTADLTWKTYLKTTTNATSATALPVGDYEFRVVGVNPAKVFGGSDVTAIPWSGQPLTSVVNGQGWTRFHVDGYTGALLFQLVEDPEYPDILSLSVVHADFQDFNLWSDAKTEDGLYTGAFVDDEHGRRGKQSGSSPDARQFPSELPQWSATGGASYMGFWSEDFSGHSTKDPSGTPAYPPYVTFKQSRTVNGWIARYSQWSHAKWHTDSNGMALLMSGDGDGMIDYSRTDIPAPHGIDEVTFDARVAQAAKFKEFVTYSGSEEIEDMTDYLFMTRAVMSTTDAATTFHGNGTVSLVGYYQPGEGCYELRAERSGDNEISIYLYKWVYDAGADEPLPHLLGRYNGRPAMNTSTYLRCSNKGGTGTEQNSASYGELFIRCTTATGKTIVEAGVMNASKKLGDSTSDTSHYCLKYEDTGSNPDLGAPLTYGTFGFGSLNCPAQIIYPTYYADGAAATVPNVTGKSADGPDTNNPKCGAGTVKYAGEENHVFKTSADLTKYKNWSIKPNKFTLCQVGGKNAVQAAPQSGKVELSTWPKGTSVETDATVWDPPVTAVGFTNNACSFTLRNDEDTFLRLATVAKSSDIVIDNIRFGQWCAASYSDADNADFYSRPDQVFACPTNFVYMNGWVTVENGQHAIALQPLRGRAGQPIAIRAPLMDGEIERGYPYPRGLGLGTFTFSYKDADEHCVLKVQYKEMDGASDLADATKSLDGWTDSGEVFDFSMMTATQRKAGKLTATLGLHETKGVMRLIVDRQVVEDARDEAKNPSGDVNYGAITITDFSATDEPPVDGACWRAWNLRTTDDSKELSLHDSASESTFALALNNSVINDVEWEDGEDEAAVRKRFGQHVPYVQSPTFFTNLINEVTFTARKLSADDPDTEVAVLGATDGGEPSDEQWEVLGVRKVSNAVFSETYSVKTKPSKSYRSFRLAVIGVSGVAVNYGDKMEIPPPPPRVLIDELSVSEGIYGSIGLYDVGAFRTPLDHHVYVDPKTNLFTIAQQPMCEESWSVQCEVRAVQLVEEISLGDDTEVWLHWYSGDKWGYKKWADDPAAKKARLARIADQPGFVYRGSYPEAPGAIVEPSYRSGTVVQYMIEVRYRTADGEWADPYFLSSGEWTKPSWYRGIDYNAERGGFAAYTILDTVAYGYAWINEVNVYDGPTPGDDVSPTNQYVEVAVPAGASIGGIEGWKLQFVTGGLADGAPLFTNTVVNYVDPEKFPDEVPCRKAKNMTGKYAFITAGSPDSCSAQLKEAGIIDGPWHVTDDEYHRGSQLKSNGRIDGGMPMAIRLVRPSGIIEHEIVISGTNRYATSRTPYPRTYSTTNYVLKLDAPAYVAREDTGDDPSLASSVTDYDGVITNAAVWAHWAKTPGRVNRNGDETENVPGNPPSPQGSMIVLHAMIENGHILQTIGDAVRTNTDLLLYVPKGLIGGTNITYDVEDWYEIKSVVETEDEKGSTTRGPFRKQKTVTLAVADNASNSVTVAVTTQERSDLVEEHGLTKDNPYTPAVMSWLSGKVRGPDKNEPFANPGGEIHKTKLVGMDGLPTGHELDLTDMYWLDIDPTKAGMVMKAGMSDKPEPIIITGPDTVYEDVVFGIKMEIYNELDGGYAHYAPYTLNGLMRDGVRTTSMDMSPDDWDSETFKVTGYLNNGLDDQKDPDKIWMPLRYFVFDRNSFDPLTFEAKVQVRDPFFQVEDWTRFIGEQVFFKWHIDKRRFGAWSVDVLKPDSTFK